MDLNVLIFSLAVSSIYLLSFTYIIEGAKQPFIDNQYKSNKQGANAGRMIFNWAYYETSSAKKLRGTRANLQTESLPSVQPGAMSSTGVRIYSGKNDRFTCIQAGWHVDPIVYNDTDTHLYVHWTNDGNQHTGCFNLACQGYTQVSQTVFPGQRIYPVSVTGKMLYYMTVTIIQDRNTGNWWWYMIKDGQMEPVGFWRDSLVPGLRGNNNYVSWGGWTQHFDNVKSPPMGNGKFPEDKPALDHQSSMISSIEITNGGGDWYPPIVVRQVTDGSNCYKLSGFTDTKMAGYKFHYGGPGGC